MGERGLNLAKSIAGLELAKWIAENKRKRGLELA